MSIPLVRMISEPAVNKWNEEFDIKARPLFIPTVNHTLEYLKHYAGKLFDKTKNPPPVEVIDDLLAKRNILFWQY